MQLIKLPKQPVDTLRGMASKKVKQQTANVLKTGYEDLKKVRSIQVPATKAGNIDAARREVANASKRDGPFWKRVGTMKYAGYQNGFVDELEKIASNI